MVNLFLNKNLMDFY